MVLKCTVSWCRSEIPGWCLDVPYPGVVMRCLGDGGLYLGNVVRGFGCWDVSRYRDGGVYFVCMQDCVKCWCQLGGIGKDGKMFVDIGKELGKLVRAG